jgi:hypothetical protein
MHPFVYKAVRTESDAIAAAGAGERYIAGGTTLIDLMREEVERPEKLININALPLDDIRVEGSDPLISGLARMAEVAAHPKVQRLQPVIAESLIEGASPQLRNVASMGGNLLQRCRCPNFPMHDAACNKRNPGSGCAAIGRLNAGHAILGTSDACVATHTLPTSPSRLMAPCVCAAPQVSAASRWMSGGIISFDAAPVTSLPGVLAVVSHLNESLLEYGPQKSGIDPAFGERLHAHRRGGYAHAKRMP